MTVDARSIRPLTAVLGVALLGAVGWQYSLVDLLVTAEWIQRRWPILLLGLLVLYVVRPFLLWPLSVISVFIGYAFGVLTGLPLVLLGTLITCLPPFLLASRLNTTDGHIALVAERGEHLVDTIGELRGMIAVRLSPAPADAVSYGASLAGVSVKVFVIGTLVGELPWALFYVLLGRSLRTFSAGAVHGTGMRLVVLAVVASGLLVIPSVYNHLRRRRE